MNAEYINLVERKKKLGTNIGALDFLLSIHKEKVDLQHKNSPLKGNDNLIHKRINEYDNVLELSKNVSAQNSGNEFSYLLGYADSLRKVGMLDTYIKIVCYLTIQSRYFKNGERVKLFEHISNALRYSRSDFLINLIFERYIEYIKHLKLSPKQKDFYFCTKFSKFHDYTKNGYKYLAFDNQADAGYGLTLLLNANDDMQNSYNLLPEQELFICNAVIDNMNIYRSQFNKYLRKYDLSEITDIYPNKIILQGIKFDKKKNVYGKDLVSIIMSVFNSEDTIAYSLHSLLNQTYENIEILVCDDCSSDKSLEIIKSIAYSDSRVKVYSSRKNQGPYNIRNELIKKAHGNFITFQDADDLSHPERIQRQVEVLRNNKAVICMANWIRVASNGKIQFFYDDKATRMSVVSSMIKKDIFATVGGYRQSLIGADTEFYETVIMRYGRESIVRLLQPLILGLWGDSGLTRNKGTEALPDGYISQSRREYSDIAARQRVLGKSIVSDKDVRDLLSRYGLFKDVSGIIEQ